MKEFKILKFLDKISSIFVSFGIDYPVMRKILQVKFLMDERRVPTVLMDGKNRKGKNSFRSALIIYLIAGIFIGLFMIPPFPIFLKMNIVMSMILFMIMTTMVSDFSAVLLDIREKTILLTKPIDSKTLNTAKLIHIISYLFSITMAISGVALIVSGVRYGVLFSLLFFFEIILICSFLILFTALFYYVIMTIYSGEKLKDIINYFQILLTVCMTLMYQFTGRIFNLANISVEMTPHLWHYFLPSAWFSAPFMILMKHDFSSYYISLSIIGVVVPIITIVIYVKSVAPRFERNLEKLNSSDKPAKISKRKEAFNGFIANILCRKPLEKTFFNFTLDMLKNERKLKLRIYPSLGFSIIFPFIFFFNIMGNGVSFSEGMAELASGRTYLFLYLTIVFLGTIFQMISLSENYKGAWIYRAMPIDNPAMILKGAFKAVLIKYIVPVYIFISVIFICVFGIKIIPSLFLIFINLLIFITANFYYSQKELPFYKDFQYAQNGSNVASVFGGFLFCAVVAGIHYLSLVLAPIGLIVNILVSLILFVILWHFAFKFSWKDIGE